MEKQTFKSNLDLIKEIKKEVRKEFKNEILALLENEYKDQFEKYLRNKKNYRASKDENDKIIYKELFEFFDNTMTQTIYIMKQVENLN